MTHKGLYTLVVFCCCCCFVFCFCFFSVQLICMSATFFELLVGHEKPTLIFCIKVIFGSFRTANKGIKQSQWLCGTDVHINNNGWISISITPQSERLHAQLSRATVKAQLGHITGLLSLSQCTSAEAESISATVGGHMPRSPGCNWTFFRLAKQATNKLASSWQNPCRTIKTWTTSQRCTLDTYILLLVQIHCVLPLVLTGFLFSSRLSSTNLCWRVPGQRRRGNYQSCPVCIGQSGSGWGVHMQE